MTAFEILKFNRELLNRMAGLGVKFGDYKYVDLYTDYEKMYSSGEKITYIMPVLSAKYGLSERGVYKIIKRLRKECTLDSVQ